MKSLGSIFILMRRAGQSPGCTATSKNKQEAGCWHIQTKRYNKNSYIGHQSSYPCTHLQMDDGSPAASPGPASLAQRSPHQALPRWRWHRGPHAAHEGQCMSFPAPTALPPLSPAPHEAESEWTTPNLPETWAHFPTVIPGWMPSPCQHQKPEVFKGKKGIQDNSKTKAQR